jgi:hypothetical protein
MIQHAIGVKAQFGAAVKLQRLFSSENNQLTIVTWREDLN